MTYFYTKISEFSIVYHSLPANNFYRLTSPGQPWENPMRTTLHHHHTIQTIKINEVRELLNKLISDFTLPFQEPFQSFNIASGWDQLKNHLVFICLLSNIRKDDKLLNNALRRHYNCFVWLVKSWPSFSQRLINTCDVAQELFRLQTLIKINTNIKLSERHIYWIWRKAWRQKNLLNTPTQSFNSKCLT